MRSATGRMRQSSRCSPKRRRDNGERDRRFRIEHAQHLRPEEIRAFAAQHVIASMQPYHAIDDGRWADKRIGPERSKGDLRFPVAARGRSYPCVRVRLVRGSDGAAHGDLRRGDPADTRREISGRLGAGAEDYGRAGIEGLHVWIGVCQFRGAEKGTIEPGKLADIAVLSDDILAIDPSRIDKVKVAITVFDGKIVYERR